MKIIIFGAGSMGSLIGSYLSKKHEVVLIDSYKAKVEKVKEIGITVFEQDGTSLTYNPRIYVSGECTETADLVISFVKDTTTDNAFKENINVIGDNTIVLSLQNGMGNDEVIRKYVDEKRILLGTTKHNAHTLDLNTIKHSGSGDSHIGSLCGNFELAKEITDIMNDCGFESIACENVNRLLWEKLFVNITINALTAILEVSMDFLSYDSPIDSAVDNVLKEAIAVAKADGEEFDFEEVKTNLYKITMNYIGGKASMEQDIEKRRITEIDFINGSVVRIGKKYGVPTPVNDTVVCLVHSKEKLLECK